MSQDSDSLIKEIHNEIIGLWENEIRKDFLEHPVWRSERQYLSPFYSKLEKKLKKFSKDGILIIPEFPLQNNKVIDFVIKRKSNDSQNEEVLIGIEVKYKGRNRNLPQEDVVKDCEKLIILKKTYGAKKGYFCRILSRRDMNDEPYEPHKKYCIFLTQLNGRISRGWGQWYNEDYSSSPDCIFRYDDDKKECTDFCIINEDCNLWTKDCYGNFNRLKRRCSRCDYWEDCMNKGGKCFGNYDKGDEFCYHFCQLKTDCEYKS